MHRRGEEGPDWKWKVRFARRNISGLCRRLGMSSRSGNTKRGSKGVSGCRENWELLCSRSLPLILLHFTVILSFLGNRWPHSSPVSIFRTYPTHLIICKRRKQLAARIWDCDFRGRSLFVMLSIFSAIVDYLSDLSILSNSVSWFWTDSTQVNTRWGLKHSAARFRIAKFESRGRVIPWKESSFVNSSM